MEPTAFALELQGPLKTALASVSLALSLPQRFDPAAATLHVRLGITDYVGLMVLPKLYRTLSREAPGITLEIVQKARDDALDLLKAGRIELATTVSPPEHRDLYSAPIADERFVCAMRRGHPLARRRLTVKGLLEYPHVVVTAHGGTAEMVDAALAEQGLTRRVPVTVPLFASAFGLLAESDLVTIVPERIARGQAGRFDLELRAPPLAIPDYTLSIVWHQRTAHDPAHRWFRQQMLAVAERIAHPQRR